MIVEETGLETPRDAQIELRADLLERLFVDEGRSLRYMQRRFGRAVKAELLALGLEVDGTPPAGCVSSWGLDVIPESRAFASIEAAVTDFLNDSNAQPERLRMWSA